MNTWTQRRRYAMAFTYWNIGAAAGGVRQLGESRPNKTKRGI